MPSARNLDLICDVCSDWYSGTPYTRGDLMVCRKCAHDLNSNDPTAWPGYYWTIFLWPMAAACGLMVQFLVLPIYLMMFLVGFGLLFFGIGALKALDRR